MTGPREWRQGAMKARDVLTHHAIITDCGDNPVFFDGFAQALLAQTPEGEGVYIAPDGELWRLKWHHEITVDEHYTGDPDAPGVCYRLVPIEEATDE